MKAGPLARGIIPNHKKETAPGVLGAVLGFCEASQITL